MITRRVFLAGSAALFVQAPPKRIGFVDDDCDNFHARVYLEALRGP